MRWLVALIVAAPALALVGTLTGSTVAGWGGVAALVAAFAAYIYWRRGVRREGRVTSE
jgi:hypothetical protein